MDDKINEMAKFNRENPGVLSRVVLGGFASKIHDDCPHRYGLISNQKLCDSGIDECVICWEQALESIKD